MFVSWKDKNGLWVIIRGNVIIRALVSLLEGEFVSVAAGAVCVKSK